MALTQQSLSARAAAAKIKLEKQLFESIVKEKQALISQAVFEELLLTAPVLTGLYRRNWIASLDNPVEEPFYALAGVTRTGEEIRPWEKERIKKLTKELKEAPLGRVVWFANNLPYANRLDNGYSKKAPAGVRDVAIQKALNRLRNKSSIDSFTVTKSKS